MDRERAISVWREYNSDNSLFRHALSVEAVMRHFARMYGEDEDFWGTVGILHDVDYQRFPEEHLAHSREILEKAGYDEDLIHAVLSHGWGLCSEIEPVARMEKVLYAVDELTGFIAACAYVRPSRSVLDMEVRSVKKKWGSVNFAAGVSREVIEKGAAMMGVHLEELIAETILALRSAASDVGLQGTL
jgi:putative nucleotidyltransferase with HDIG domain